MSTKLKQDLTQRKQKMLARIDKRTGEWVSPMLNPPAIHYQLAQRQQAIAAGGIGSLLQLIRQLDVRTEINRALRLFKLHMPYDEADHVLNIALNLLSGGNCLEHLEDRRCDEAYLNAVNAVRIPDPTTAGDFCRRFGDADVVKLMDAFNRVRQRAWKQQPKPFFDTAVIEADGTQIVTGAQKKQGIGINYKGEWGYHPLVVTLAQTREPLFIVNRSGNRPSQEHASHWLDRAASVCREAGFRKVEFRGDTAFSEARNFDRWDADGIGFVFCYNAVKRLVTRAERRDKSHWEPLIRDRDAAAPPKNPRAKRPKYKHQIVVAQKYRCMRLAKEAITEFSYRPVKCNRAYRVIAVRKTIHVTRGQMRLFDEEAPRYFFYITNATKEAKPARQVVREANRRCDQENHIAQLKQCALKAPLHDLVSNWAYMAIASLAWNLKAWSGLMIKPEGTAKEKREQTAMKTKLIAMDFSTFRDRVLMVPAQIIRQGRRLIYRLLSYRPSVDLLMLINANVRRPLLI